MRTPNEKPGKSSAKIRTVQLPEYSKLNEELIEQFNTFVEAVPAGRLSRKLRNLFLVYLMRETEGLPVKFEEFVEDFYLLIGFLDVIEKELPDHLY